jgi:HEPN domain-containing protein
MPPKDEYLRLVRQWLKKAEQDLRGAELMEQTPRLLGLVAFHCQQAVEKALRGFLTLHNLPFRKTHDLTELLRQCEDIDIAFAHYVDAASFLSPFAADFRYPGEAGDLSPDQAFIALRAARDVLTFVRVRVSEADQP